MEIKIKSDKLFRQKKFIINQEKGVVVCLLMDTNIKQLRGSHLFKGKAKLAPGEEWNEKVGMEIAEARALIKVYRAMAKGVRDNIRYIEDEIFRYNKELEFYNVWKQQLESKLTKYEIHNAELRRAIEKY